MDKDAECYSGFADVYGTKTNLASELQNRGVEEVYVCGLALDYCVLHTCLGAVKEGFTTYCLIDLTKGVSLDTSLSAIEELLQNGVKVVVSSCVS